jgi:LPXTG-site transpeptidase (sortase) family protein
VSLSALIAVVAPQTAARVAAPLDAPLPLVAVGSTELLDDTANVTWAEEISVKRAEEEAVPLPAAAEVNVQHEPAAAAPATAPPAAPVQVSAPAAVLRVPPSLPLPAGARLRVSAIGVDAPMLAMGVRANGVMEAPTDDSSVGWYNFSALPGEAGNALVSGHVDWIDHPAVFWGLRQLRPGDEIQITGQQRTVVYVVQTSYAVPSNLSDVSQIVGSRSGPPTLTLITCEGTFIRSQRAYDQRLVVVAALRP